MTKRKATMPHIEKMPLASMDLKEAQIEKLKELFPEAFTEGNKIDWEKLKLTLGENVEVGKERFGMNWPGKADCFKTIQQPSIATLVPAREESIDFDQTENLFIEGDNLEVLKLLQKSYLGKIKMIYIDPPYNTGNDFIYPDNYAENLSTYLEYTGQVDSEGKKFSTNTETDGRFHSKWMNMMYPRLFLAKNLLSDDGLIFISIDDAEYSNLRNLCNEIFGEENFVDNIIWKKRYGGGAKEKFLVSLHEYILVFSKNILEVDPIFIPNTQESIDRYYIKTDSNSSSRGKYRTHPLEATKSMGERKNLVFGIPTPDGKEAWPKRQWLWSKERALDALNKGELEFIKDREGNWTVHTKQYLKDEDGKVREVKAFSIIDDVYTQHGTNEIIEIFNDAQMFSFPKPTGLLKKLVNIGAPSGNDIVLDMFAGSASMADCILKMNLEDNGNRRFICIQLPEIVSQDSSAFKAGYKNIAEIAKKRIQIISSKIKKESKEKNNAEKSTLFGNKADVSNLDLGFKVLKLQPSNFKFWDSNTSKNPEDIQIALELHIKHIAPEAKQESILFEILLKSGFEPSTSIEKVEIEGKQIFSIEKGELLVCLEKNLTLELIKAIAEREPTRVICLDEGFQNNDQLKTNAVQIMKSKNVLNFRTV